METYDETRGCAPAPLAVKPVFDRLAKLVRITRQRHDTRRQLAQLSDHLARDIGLTPADLHDLRAGLPPQRYWR